MDIKSRIHPESYIRLQQEVATQGASVSKLTACAIELYLDCMIRARNGGTELVNILGYRA